MKFYVIPLYNSWKISKILQGNTFWRARYVDQIGLAENLAEGKGHCVQAPPQMLISTADGRGGGQNFKFRQCRLDANPVARIYEDRTRRV